MITCQATESVGRAKNDRVHDNMYIFMITCTSSNCFGNILYNMINQGLCFLILLIGIRELNKKKNSCCYCVCVVCEERLERERKRERDTYLLQGDSVMGEEPHVNKHHPVQNSVSNFSWYKVAIVTKD